jgi:hypothetical protein
MAFAAVAAATPLLPPLFFRHFRCHAIVLSRRQRQVFIRFVSLQRPLQMPFSFFVIDISIELSSTDSRLSLMMTAD